MTKEINAILGSQIKNQRWKNNITREALAEKVNVSPRFLADVEAGKIGVSIQTLKQLSQALNTSSDSLLGLDMDQNDNLLMLTKKLQNTNPRYYPLVSTLLDEIGRL